jgi:hypothetical protein
MKHLLRRLGTALVFASALLAPWVAVGLYNNVQITDATAPDGYGFLNNVTGNVPLMFSRGDQVGRWSSTGARQWAFDEKAQTLYIADLGTASDALLASDTSGIIAKISVAWGTTLTSANAVMKLYRVTTNLTSLATNSYQAGLVSTFALSPLTTMNGGGILTDDTIFQAVNMGDLIAVETDGGPNNVVPVYVTITIRPPAF